MDGGKTGDIKRGDRGVGQEESAMGCKRIETMRAEQGHDSMTAGALRI